MERSMAHGGRRSSGTARPLSLLLSGPYVLAVAWFGLLQIGADSYPRALGMHYSTDSTETFPSGGTGFFIGVVALSIAVGIGRTFIRAARGSQPATWIAIGFLLVAILFAWGFARSPNEERRCFVDGYSDTRQCAGASTIALRDFTMLASPAVAAIACLTLGRPHPWRSVGMEHGIAATHEEPASP